MSRATLTRSLGSTTDPTVLIPGDPVAVRADADRMDALAADLSRSAGAVAGTEFGGWTGQARDAYVAGKDALHARLSMAATSIPAAAGALRQYAAVLETAQAEARVLARQWRTAAACAPVEPGVLAASTLAPEQLRAQARYDRLLGDVHAVATAVAATIEAATTDAPIVPTFWNRLGQRWSEFWSAPVEDIGNMLALWWSVSTIRYVTDPEGTMLSFGQLLLGLQTSLQDPRQFAKDLIDWDTWQTSPASALGSLAPDIALALVTGGVGAAAVRGARSTANAGIRAAAASALRAGARTAWENSAISTTTRAMGTSLSGFWNARRGPVVLVIEGREYTAAQLMKPTPGDGPMTFALRSHWDDAQTRNALEHVDMANAARLEGHLAEEGRVSTKGKLADEARLAAREERVRAERAGTPYSGVAGHVPDSTWTGKPTTGIWQDQNYSVNSAFGSQARHMPLGFKPTVFQAETPDGRTLRGTWEVDE